MYTALLLACLVLNPISLLLSLIALFLLLRENKQAVLRNFDKLVFIYMYGGFLLFHSTLLVYFIFQIDRINVILWVENFKDLHFIIKLVYSFISITSSAGLLVLFVLWKSVSSFESLACLRPLALTLTSSHFMKIFFYGNCIISVVLIQGSLFMFPDDWIRQFAFVEFIPVITRFIFAITSIPAVFDLARVVIHLGKDRANRGHIYFATRNYFIAVLLASLLMIFGSYTYIDFIIEGGFSNVLNPSTKDHWSHSTVIRDIFHYSFVFFSASGAIVAFPVILTKVLKRSKTSKDIKSSVFPNSTKWFETRNPGTISKDEPM